MAQSRKTFTLNLIPPIRGTYAKFEHPRTQAAADRLGDLHGVFNPNAPFRQFADVYRQLAQAWGDILLSWDVRDANDRAIPATGRGMLELSMDEFRAFLSCLARHDFRND